MSNHIDSLKIGESLELMGPVGHFRYAPSFLAHLDSISMVAGGTGITPIFQLLQHLMGIPDGATKITLIYANETFEDILLKDQLESWAKQYPERFELVYLIRKVVVVLHQTKTQATEKVPSKGSIHYETGGITPRLFMHYAHTKVSVFQVMLNPISL